MQAMRIAAPALLGALLAVLGLVACEGGRPNAASTPGVAEPTGPRLIQIAPGPQAERLALEAFFDARPGDVIEFGAGQFDFANGLLLFDRENITIRGAGIESTLLSFANSANKEGIFASHVRGLTIEDLTVEDMPGDGIKVSDAEHVVIRRTRVRWTNADPEHPNYDATRESWSANGAYAFYPVLSRDLLLEDSISVGSSDVGFYVGQSTRVVVRNNLAFHNVQGYEFENTDDSEMYDNLARDNAGGFLAVDLPGRTQYGDRNRFYRNVAVDNNIDNFAPKGTIAAAVPRGTGMIILATDQVEVFDNEFRNNDTLGLVVVAYKLVDSSRDPQYDYYAEGIHIHDNLFANNGSNPQLPNLGPEDLPDPTSNPSLLPLLIMLKNFGQTAHIVWDGYSDTLNADCSYPQGTPADERGKPQYSPEHPAPDCGTQENGEPVRYNAYKFDAQGELIRPEQWLCIQNNTFEDGAVPVPPFVNFQGTVPAPVGGEQDGLPASRDQTPHDCALPPLPPTQIRPYRPSGGGTVAASPAEVLRVCKSGPAGAVNWAALAYNCPDLADYGLFADPQDPLSAPRGLAMPYDLTTPLFSDYALKRRTVHLRPGAQARWRGAEAGPDGHVELPLNSVISKTFYFPHPEGQQVVETRLLIKRQTENGPLWQGLPYVWDTGADGRRSAQLAVAGATRPARWDYEEPDARVVDATGQRPRYSGSTASYAIPQANQCVSCHAREGLVAGSAPIGPKPRGLDRDYDYGGALGIRNQLEHWCGSGFMRDCPDDLSAVETLATWNLPGSGGADPGSDEDIEQRARAYLEANCSHCHTPRGVAKSTRLNLDRYILSEGLVRPRPVDRDYGICKSPVASGRGTGDRLYDIVPGDPQASILHFRLDNADDPAIRMPPIARSVRHDEGFALIEQWIGVLPLPTTQDDNCSGPLGALPIGLPFR